MLPYPRPTSREEKIDMIDKIKDRLLKVYGDEVLAIGAYGSIALGTDGPYSDIELHVVTRDGTSLKGYEFVYDPFKIEISFKQKKKLLEQAVEVDDSWSIKAGVFTNILAIYDPKNIFEELRELPLQVSDIAIKKVMREFMIWEPYETMGKIRNNYVGKNVSYIPMGATDLVWQTSKLIGLANRQIFSTRARVYEESLVMKSRPFGFEELVRKVMEGKLGDIEQVYTLCENLWMGLNEWYEELGITYKLNKLPF
ncbi:kanamycin nucleotidyltransferase C-terminal domain-containing protein [Bacillus sp. AK128]